MNKSKFLALVNKDAKQDYGYAMAYLGRRLWAKNGTVMENGKVLEWYEWRKPYVWCWVESFLFWWPRRGGIV